MGYPTSGTRIDSMREAIKNRIERRLNMAKKMQKAVIFTDTRTGKRRCLIDPMNDAKLFARWLLYEDFVQDLEIIDIDQDLPETACLRLLTKELPSLFARKIG